MKNLGFTSLHGYDFVPGFIERARQRDADHSIRFEVQDATSLSYEDASFDQIVYLQQFICVLDDEAARAKALKEAYRVLRVGGTALFSFLSLKTKSGGAGLSQRIWRTCTLSGSCAARIARFAISLTIIAAGN